MHLHYNLFLREKCNKNGLPLNLIQITSWLIALYKLKSESLDILSLVYLLCAFCSSCFFFFPTTQWTQPLKRFSRVQLDFDLAGSSISLCSILSVKKGGFTNFVINSLSSHHRKELKPSTYQGLWLKNKTQCCRCMFQFAWCTLMDYKRDGKCC